MYRKYPISNRGDFLNAKVHKFLNLKIKNRNECGKKSINIILKIDNYKKKCKEHVIFPRLKAVLLDEVTIIYKE